MNIKIFPALAALALAATGCGAATGTSASTTPTPTPNPTSTPQPGTPPQLRPANLRFALARGVDAYEPNDAAPYYLGAGVSYTVADGYLDPVDVSWTVDVVNDGGEVSGSFDVALHVGSVVLTQTLDGISAGATRSVTFTASDADPGTQTTWADVDPRAQIAESDEVDNMSVNVDAAVTADVDCFSVYQISGRALGVTLDQLPADYDVELLDPSGTLVASSRNAGLGMETISSTATSTGNWMVRVLGYNGARSASYPYRLKIDAP